MNPKYYVFLLSILSFSLTYAQERFRISVKDSLGKPIAYCSVIWGKSMGLVTDPSGYIEIPDKSKIDSLIISAIGFTSDVILKDSLLNKAEIEVHLVRSIVGLPEIIIVNYDFEQEFGCIDIKSQSSFFKNSICSNLQAALKINGYKNPAVCKSLSVFIAKQSSANIPYRLRIYEIGENNLPGKDLLSENIIISTYKTNSWNTYSLDSMNIQLPKKGFFAAVEWLCTDIKSENGLCIGLTNKIDDPSTFYKYGNIGWTQLKIQSVPVKDNIMIKVAIRSVK